MTLTSRNFRFGSETVISVHLADERLRPRASSLVPRWRDEISLEFSATNTELTGNGLQC